MLVLEKACYFEKLAYSRTALQNSIISSLRFRHGGGMKAFEVFMHLYMLEKS